VEFHAPAQLGLTNGQGHQLHSVRRGDTLTICVGTIVIAVLSLALGIGLNTRYLQRHRGSGARALRTREIRAFSGTPWSAPCARVLHREP